LQRLFVVGHKLNYNMNFGEKEYIKQTRANGREYYAASVKVIYKWFFGMLTYTDTFYVCMGSSRPYLSNYDDYYHWFSSLSDAKENLEIAIYKEKLKRENEKVVSVTKIKE
jgi:hypothetical protein